MDEVFTTIIRYYPHYGLNDIFEKTFMQGGLTLGQVSVLHENLVLQQIDDLKSQAGMHGIDIEEDNKPDPKKNLTFGKPEDYKDMTEKERKDLTNKMMAKFKPFAGKVLKSTKKGN